MALPIPSPQRSSNALAEAFHSYTHSQTFRYESHFDSAMSSRHNLGVSPTQEDGYLRNEDLERSSFLSNESRRPSSPDLRRFHSDTSHLLGSINEDTTPRSPKANPFETVSPLSKSSSNALLVPQPSYGSFSHPSPPLQSMRSNDQLRLLKKRPSLHSNTVAVVSHISGTSHQEVKTPTGASTYGQSLFNSIAVLVGIGILSEPLAFASAGWIVGPLLIIFYAALSCYTAKILGRIILSDPTLQTYADIGRKAFGPRANLATSFFFCLELFFVSCVFVTLAADSLNSMFPAVSANTYKMIGLVILFPSMFVPLRLISYASALGIISTVFLIFVVFVDGFSKDNTPGSLYESAPTDIIISDPMKLGAAFGLFMSGFAGHAVIPSLARDMKEPHRFERMVDWAFIVATLLYALIGVAGYIMFGRDVSDEISLDLLHTPGYNLLLNRIAIWMLVITPLTKFPLTTRALNITVEIMLNIHEPPMPENAQMQEVNHPHPDDPSSLPPHSSMTIHNGFLTLRLKPFLRVIERLVLACTIVAVCVIVPQFSTLMAFLGAFSAFTICVIGPLAAKIALERKVEFRDAIILLIVVPMTVWGTYVSCTSGDSGL